MYLDLFYENSVLFPCEAETYLEKAEEYLIRIISDCRVWPTLLSKSPLQIARLIFFNLRKLHSFLLILINRLLWFRGLIEACRQNTNLAKIYIQQAEEILKKHSDLNQSNFRVNLKKIEQKLRQFSNFHTFDNVWMYYEQGNMNSVYQILSENLLHAENNSANLLSEKNKTELLEMLYKVCTILKKLIKEKIKWITKFT